MLPLAPKDTGWSKKSVGVYAKRSGVYIHYCGQEIIYIGKATTGRRGNFGDRMRREFHETSASNDYLHRFLVSQTSTIETRFLDLEEVDRIVDGERVEFSKERKALILEQVLIGQYNPPGNRM